VDELWELIEYERWRQAKLEAQISSYQCRILRLGELLHSDTSVISSLTSTQVAPALLNRHFPLPRGGLELGSGLRVRVMGNG